MGAQVRVRFLDKNVCSETHQAGAPCQVGVKLQSSCHTNAAKSGHIIRPRRWENIHTFFIVRQVVPPLLLVFTVYIEFSQNTISQKAWDTVFMICSMVYMLCTHDMSQDGRLFS